MRWSSSRSSPPDQRPSSISGSERCRVRCRSRSLGARSSSWYHGVWSTGLASVASALGTTPHEPSTSRSLPAPDLDEGSRPATKENSDPAATASRSGRLAAGRDGAPLSITESELVSFYRLRRDQRRERQHGSRSRSDGSKATRWYRAHPAAVAISAGTTPTAVTATATGSAPSTTRPPPRHDHHNNPVRQTGVLPGGGLTERRHRQPQGVGIQAATVTADPGGRPIPLR